MSTVVDVGDATEVTFTTTPGATVTVSWLNPDQAAVLDAVPVAESPTGSGRYTRIFTATSAGMWTAVFTASVTTSAVERYFVRALAVTGPMPLASDGDVAAQFTGITPAQQGLARYLVRPASALLRHRARQEGLNIDADIDAGKLDPDLPALTVTNMVLRVLRNPGGLRAETTGPFSKTFDTTAAAGLLVVTDYDLAAITTTEALPDGVASLGVGTIRVTPGLAPPAGYPRPAWGPYGRY